MAVDLVPRGSERRRALRMPVRGVAVFYGEDGAFCGAIENLSKSGALVHVAGAAGASGGEALGGRDLRSAGSTTAWWCGMIDVELKLGVDTGWVSARTVRVGRDQIAVEFDQIDDALRAAIEAAIAAAVRAAKRRPILVIDQRGARRRDLVAKLSARGMSPLAPKTPLEAVDLLSRTNLHVNVCLLAPSFGHSIHDLRTLLAHSFPWVSTEEIDDDLDATVERAIEAWSTTDVARLASAIS
jgi:hypothetical protein